MNRRRAHRARAWAYRMAAGGVLVTAASCASVAIRKVPTPTQYPDRAWTSADQASADAIEGLRFYLPRPWVNVFESFPIATDIYLADGEVSPDGQFVRIDRLRAGSALDGMRASEAPFRAGDAIAARQIFRGPAPGRAESGEQDLEGATGRLAELERQLEEERTRRLAAEGEAARAGEASGPAETPAPGPTTGVTTTKVTNDNSAFAYVPLRGNMDIIYLPDFDEQYAVVAKSGLGNVNVATNLGQGWSLQGLDAVSDNSRLNELVFGLLESAQKAAAQVVTGGGAALADMARLGIDTAGRPESGESLLDERPVPGTPVTLKIAIVHYAAKGLYPVIKPRELTQTGGSLFVLNMLARSDHAGASPAMRALRAMSDAEIQAAIADLDLVRSRMTVPVYPYQYISFNTFRYMSIEALTPASSGFGERYDRTGVSGERGDAQVADFADVIRDALRRNMFTPRLDEPTNGPPASSDLGEQLVKLEAGLAEKVQAAARAAAESSLDDVRVERVRLELATKDRVAVTVFTAEALDADQQTALVPIAKQVVQDVVGSASGASRLKENVADPVIKQTPDGD